MLYGARIFKDCTKASAFVLNLMEYVLWRLKKWLNTAEADPIVWSKPNYMFKQKKEKNYFKDKCLAQPLSTKADVLSTHTPGPWVVQHIRCSKIADPAFRNS